MAPVPAGPSGTLRRRSVRAASLTLLLAGLFGYCGAVSVLVQGLDSPSWWSWLWLAVPATALSWLVLLLDRPRGPPSPS